jgi:hypothetical protein
MLVTVLGMVIVVREKLPSRKSDIIHPMVTERSRYQPYRK